jgi:hypothetical protein
MSHSLRSIATEEEYRKYKETKAVDSPCVLCSQEPIQTFKYWKITKNDFPYDLIAETHHMISPIRHAKELELTEEEKSELLEIKANSLNFYDAILESTPRMKTVPAHHHLHIFVTKDIASNLCLS